MMQGRSVALGVVGIVLLLAVPAYAAPGNMHLTADLPVHVDGAHNTTAQGAFLLIGDAGSVDLAVTGASGTVTRVIHRAFGYVDPTEPSLELTWKEEVERKELSLDGAILTLQQRRPDLQILLYDTPLVMTTDGRDVPLDVGALTEPKEVVSALPRSVSVRLHVLDEATPFQHTLPAGQHQLRVQAGAVTTDGAFSLFISDAVLDYHNAASGTEETIRAHFRVEERPGSVYDPIHGRWTGVGTHTEYIQEYLVADQQGGRVDLRYHGLPGTMYAAAPTVDVTGTMDLPAAHGTITVQGEDGTITHDLDGQDLRIGGAFQVTFDGPLPGYGRTTADGEGDLTQVQYGSVDATYDWTPAIVAAGIGAVLLGVGAWLVSNKAALGGFGGFGGLVAGYARVQGEDVLEHPGRQEVYERVKAHPGINFIQLGDQVEFGASTLNYHLRVLERNGYLMRVRDGRYVRFFDRQSGLYSRDKKLAVSALRNEKTAAIADHIRTHPGIAQCDLAKAFGIAASTVNWHIRRLVEAGLVEKQRDQHFTRYYLGEAWATLPAMETAVPA